MRVVIIAPWFRTLAQIYGRALQRQGHDALVVTTGAHFEPGYGFIPEIVLPARLKTHEWPGLWLAARRRLAAWRPDLALVDQTWDLRLSALGMAIPHAVVVHDAGPHDASHIGPRWQRALVDRQRSKSQRLVCFSEAVASQLAVSARKSAAVVPLTSELRQDLVGALAPASRRKHFLVLGRVSPYKNLGTVFEAWSSYTQDAGYRGDHLVLIGDGELSTPLPAAVRWERGRFSFADVASRLHEFKASIVMYESASQSGAQLTSMQLGVSTIASDTAGLAEYQPAFRRCLRPHDVQGLVAGLLELTDPEVAAREGALAREHYETRFRDDVAAEALLRACADLVSP